MKLYANGILLNAAAQSVTLEKSRGDAAATLTAVLLTAAADRYFPKESLALGDAVRLLGDAGEEVFLGAVQAVSRNVETVTLIACDRGLYLTANELSGVFAGSPEGICRAVAMRLSLPVGTLEVPAGWKRLVAGAGVRAFDILRQAVGEEREISIQNGALTVTKAGQERFVIAEETVLASRGTADARQMVNRCAVIDRRGAAAATAQNTTDLARFGLRQRVLGKSGDAAAQAQGAGRATTRSAPQASAACTRTGSGRSGSAPRWVSLQLMATATRCAPSARACASCHAWPLWKGSYSAMMPANFMELLLFAKRLLNLYRIYRKTLPFPGFVGRMYKNLVHKFYRFARVAP